jgi:hypothetical protein
VPNVKYLTAAEIPPCVLSIVASTYKINEKPSKASNNTAIFDEHIIVNAKHTLIYRSIGNSATLTLRLTELATVSINAYDPIIINIVTILKVCV